MKAYLISDNVDTQVGMRLAGIKGVVVHTKEELIDEIKKATNDKEIGIILITEKASLMARDEINSLKLNMGLPLIEEIPDRHGTIMEKDRISKYIKEAIGVKI